MEMRVARHVFYHSGNLEINYIAIKLDAESPVQCFRRTEIFFRHFLGENDGIGCKQCGFGITLQKSKAKDFKYRGIGPEKSFFGKTLVFERNPCPIESP